MAETAKILNPDKTVLLPKLEAICSLADMAAPCQVREFKEKYPDAAVVSYINTSAEVKAMSDICCTSANAVKVINSLPNKRIIFLPDKNLGRYVQQFTDKELILWDGQCVVHSELDKEKLLQFKKEYPGCKIIAHPECKADILEAADYISDTGGMAKIAQQDNSANFIVVTECGMVQKLREDVPGKNFYSFCNLCPYMKATDLQSVYYDSLILNKHEIDLPTEIMDRARESITRMLAIT
jgi:quinolinate synthase